MTLGLWLGPGSRSQQLWGKKSGRQWVFGWNARSSKECFFVCVPSMPKQNTFISIWNLQDSLKSLSNKKGLSRDWLFMIIIANSGSIKCSASLLRKQVLLFYFTKHKSIWGLHKCFMPSSYTFPRRFSRLNCHEWGADGKVAQLSVVWATLHDRTWIVSCRDSVVSIISGIFWVALCYTPILP